MSKSSTENNGRNIGNTTPDEQQDSSTKSESVSGSHRSVSQDSPDISSVQLSLPKGGGAIQSIDEKFSVNPMTGTASLSIPIYTSPNRQEFHSELSLSYNSGVGNGPFGLGFSLSIPSITRKTGKGLPTYRDEEDMDTFILSGAEDLVPVYVQKDGESVREVLNKKIKGTEYLVHPYRPRTEGLFSRIERWVNVQDGIPHWRSITKDHITSIYGKDEMAKVRHPKHTEKIFRWNIEQSYDTKGNIISYEYKQEDLINVPQGSLQEKSRLEDPKNISNRYIKRIKYGNKIPFKAEQWLFEVVFDYGEHKGDVPTRNTTDSWEVREDPFSTYKAGFEIRTYRLCKRILMFHHMEELGDEPFLVRSTNFTYNHQPTLTTLAAVNQTGFQKTAEDNEYDKKSLPPLEFTYSQPTWEHKIHYINERSVENVPMGVDGDKYKWVDLDGEGLLGILTQQKNNWYYKRNHGDGQFGTLEPVDPVPSTAGLQTGVQQLSDVSGNGRLDLMQLDGTRSGFYARTKERSWESFESFQSIPNVDWEDANLRFIDLTGDGQSDLLLTEDRVFTYYPSKGSEGFGLPKHVQKVIDEEKGPNLVFSDGTQSVYLADMSGDGLTDIVRIRNGEICYWPNIGYGHFGERVLMGQSPHFTSLDQFDQGRIRLADVDGSGTTDIIYLDNAEVIIWFNQAGNSWSKSQIISWFPPVDNLASVQVMDLLGLGTACLVWSSPLPTRTYQPIAYMDLMGGHKPHLLVSMENNMGKKKSIHYASSTKFYLEDKERGQPWITTLPFPVHVVEKVEIEDQVTDSIYRTHYKYHHGHYDGTEREFRGFGHVEQWDAEQFFAGNAEEEQDSSLYQPPVLTKTWFHTGAFINRNRMTDHFRKEYYNRDGDAHVLPDTLFPENLSVEEKRQACRALKGQVLRTEIYAQDNSSWSEHPYQVIENGYRLQCLQPVQSQYYAVFHVYPSESITYNYERNSNDPRVQHELVLQIDDFGNATQSAEAAYSRRKLHVPDDSDFNPQKETLITYTEMDYVNQLEYDDYRIGILNEQRAYEITGLAPSSSSIFQVDELFRMINEMDEIPFEETSTDQTPQKRLYQQLRIDYWKDDLTGPLDEGETGVQMIPYETYEKTFTSGLLEEVYAGRVDAAMLNEAGYVEIDGAWWLPSGKETLDPSQFYMPIEYTDPFGAVYTTTYDDYALLPRKTISPSPLPEDGVNGNVVVVENNYRVLQIEQMTDPNGNRTNIQFDSLGLVTATATMGKLTETKGDSLEDFQPLQPNNISESVAHPHRFLQKATTRYIVDLNCFRHHQEPVNIHVISRETHDSELDSDEITNVQQQVIYWDGLGREILTKAKAEGGKAPLRDLETDELIVENGQVQMVHSDTRWVGSGRTVYDNKGNVIKEYEPFFSDRHDYEKENVLVMWGVTPIMGYDPLGRLIRTDYPDGTFEKIQFDAWKEEQWDRNDTVKESQWYIDRGAPDPASETLPSDAEGRSAWLAVKHARTPKIKFIDPLARSILLFEDNGDVGTYRSRIEYDAFDQPKTIFDHKQRVVMTHRYNMVGLEIYTKCMDSGNRQYLPAVDEQFLYEWTNRGHQIKMSYDPLRRPLERWINGQDDPYVSEKVVYGEYRSDNVAHNLRGQIYQQYDQSGIVTYPAYDFKGNVLENSRKLTAHYEERIDWSNSQEMEADSFKHQWHFDALNRVESQQLPDNSTLNMTYDVLGALSGVNGLLRGVEEAIFVSHIDYNAKGQRERILYGNGTQSDYTYDKATFRPIGLSTMNVSDRTILQDLTYTYDPVGNITEIVDQAQQDVYFENSVVAPNTKYEYDPLYRLVKATGREKNSGASNPPGPNGLEHTPLPHPNDNQSLLRYEEEYDYDEVGNILHMVHRMLNNQFKQLDWSRHYQYEEESNRLLSTSLPGDLKDPEENSGGTYSGHYAYDVHGNMIEMPHLSSLDWGVSDELLQVDLGGGGTEFYTYDMDGQRVRKVHQHSGSTVEEWIYLEGFEIYRKHRNGEQQFVRETLHIMDDQRRIALLETKTYEDSEKVTSPIPVQRYQLSNHLESSSLELNEKGDLLSYEEYFPFGKTSYYAVNKEAGISRKRYRFTGKEKDEQTGLYYYGARYYAAWLGRWTSTDPAGFVDGLNLYVYVKNNPLNFIDPEGTQSLGVAIINHRADPPDESDRISTDRSHIKQNDTKESWGERNPIKKNVAIGAISIVGGVIVVAGVIAFAPVTAAGAVGAAVAVVGGTASVTGGSILVGTSAMDEDKVKRVREAVEMIDITKAENIGSVMFGEDGKVIGKTLDDIIAVGTMFANIDGAFSKALEGGTLTRLEKLLLTKDLIEGSKADHDLSAGDKELLNAIKGELNEIETDSVEEQLMYEEGYQFDNYELIRNL